MPRPAHARSASFHSKTMAQRFDTFIRSDRQRLSLRGDVSFLASVGPEDPVGRVNERRWIPVVTFRRGREYGSTTCTAAPGGSEVFARQTATSTQRT